MMTNMEKYASVFKETFGIDDAALGEQLTYQSIPEWDSVGHMSMIAELEDRFSILLDTDDIVDFSSYTVGIEMLKKYGVQL